jgi:methylated-DNA-protein-cysteine methyltransferase related protein
MHKRSLKGIEESGGKRDKLQPSNPDAVARIWQVVAMIPPGKVATYGQIAKLVGLPSHARFVGRTLANLPAKTKLPWYRVVNATRRVSLRGGGEERQKTLLRADGITFIGERIAKTHLWEAGE